MMVQNVYIAMINRPLEMEAHLAKQCKSVPSNIKAIAIQYLRDCSLTKAKKKRKVDDVQVGQTKLNDYCNDGWMGKSVWQIHICCCNINYFRSQTVYPFSN